MPLIIPNCAIAHGHHIAANIDHRRIQSVGNTGVINRCMERGHINLSGELHFTGRIRKVQFRIRFTTAIPNRSFEYRIQQGEIDIIQLHRGSIIVFRGLIISSDNLLLGFPIYQFKQCPLYIEIPLTLEDNTAYRNIIDFQTVKCDIGIQNTTPHCRSHRCRTVGKATDAVSAPICDL